jgi:hypothetical protein
MEDTGQPILTVSRGQADVLRKVGDIMLTVDETIAYTGYSRTFLAEHVEIPRTGKPVRFRLSDLDRYIDAQTVNGFHKRGAA